MRFSMFCNPISPGPDQDKTSIDASARLALKADRANFAAIYLAEHHFSDYSAYGSNFMMAAYLAPQMRNSYLGLAVAVVPLNHPARLAQQANLLDNLTNGRFVFGVGAGGIPLESMGLGIDPSSQGTLTNPMMDVVLDLWAKKRNDPPYDIDTPSFKGRVLERIMPRAFRAPHPLIKRACQSEASIRYSAEKGWSTFMFPRFVYGDYHDNLKKWLNLYRDTLESSGHSPELIAQCMRWTSANGPVNLSFNEAQARRRYDENNASYMNWVKREMALLGMTMPEGGHGGKENDKVSMDMVGTPEQVIEVIARYEALGFQELIIGFDLTVYNEDKIQEAEDNLDMFIQEVMPHFAERNTVTEAPIRAFA